MKPETIADKKHEPAKPVSSVITYKGLSRYEYYVTHAPKEIPQWFQPTLSKRPELIDSLDMKFGAQSQHPKKEEFIRLWNDEIGNFEKGNDEEEVSEDLNKEVMEYFPKLEENRNKFMKWKIDCDMQRSFQWPLYWADMIISYIDKYNAIEEKP
jgi:hypothetical protein